MNDAQRELERAKYVRSYAGVRRYGMGNNRRVDAVADLKALPIRGAYLDVSCGRGEMLAEAKRLGFAPCRGTEIVPALIDGKQVVEGWAHDLPFPDNSFDVVSLFDVIEHLLPGDDEAVCRELARVAARHIVIAANNLPSRNGDGDELHVNRREYVQWDSLLNAWFTGCRVTRLGVRSSKSCTWRVDL